MSIRLWIILLEEISIESRTKKKVPLMTSVNIWSSIVVSYTCDIVYKECCLGEWTQLVKTYVTKRSNVEPFEKQCTLFFFNKLTRIGKGKGNNNSITIYTRLMFQSFSFTLSYVFCAYINIFTHKPRSNIEPFAKHASSFQ